MMAPAPDIPAGCEMTRNWAVTVQAEGAGILTISSEHIAGVDDIAPWESTILGCARHLVEFVGPQTIDIDTIALDVAREIKSLDPIAMPGGHAQHLAAIQSLVADGIRAVTEGAHDAR
ncbi:MAG: hypothetical protein E2576_14540 [Alcaligenaceae bacterium]|nr:hypothetical protein [Alcaligenaceae bacterium SAGV5]MPS50401.1 hypothetical protein [Alcaligenaceae bacterium SAGV3]MPT57938.1 hypothetical protein [Alcaligenaceae bacterium]